MRMPIIKRVPAKNEIRPVRTLLDDFIKNAFYQPDKEERMMAMDVIENEKQFILTANLPGIKKSNIKVYIDGSELVIEGKREEKKVEENENTYRCERYAGSYRRAFTIADTWDCSNIEANYQDGVLRLTIPKKEAEPEKVIKIT